jgi:hypothetical protein
MLAMAVIGFRYPDQGWVVARWAFRQILDDVASQFPDDHQMKQQFEQAIALDGLHLDLLSPEVADKIADCICRVATGILNGSIHSTVTDRYPDARTPEMYREGLLSLVRSLECKNA